MALLREARLLLARKAAVVHAGGPAEELRALWASLGELEQKTAAAFPLSDGACRELRAQLRERIAALHAGEQAASARSPTSRGNPSRPGRAAP